MVVVSALNDEVYRQVISSYERLKQKGAVTIDGDLYEDLYREFSSAELWLLHDDAWRGFLILLRSGDGLILNPYFFTGAPMVEDGCDTLANDLMVKALEIYDASDCNRLYVTAMSVDIEPHNKTLLERFGLAFDYSYVDMSCQLPKKVTKPKKPDGISLKRVKDYTQEQLKTCFDEVYKDSDVAYYHHLSAKEKTSFYEDVCFDGVMDHLCSIALEKDGVLIGYVFVFDYDKQPYITNMCMRTAYRGQGYGSYMLQVLMFLAKEKGYRSIGLGTERKMKAFMLYKRFGFIIERRRNYYIKHK